METLILYFSGTGNSLVCARNIQKAFPGSLLQRIHSKTKLEINCDNLFIVVPTYAYGVPDVVFKYLKKAVIKTNYSALIATYGTKTGGLFRQVYRLFKSKNINLDYYAGIQSVENFFPLFNSITREKIDGFLEDQKTMTNAVINDLQNKVSKAKPKAHYPSRLVSKLYRAFRPVVNRSIKVHKDICVGCGVCSKVCSNGAIVVNKETKKAEITVKKCQTCQACLNFCPYKAITQLRFQNKTPRYHHPEIKVSEIKNYPLTD